MKTYKLITNVPYDKDAPVSFWIAETTTVYFFKFILRRKTRYIGDYTIDDSRGELGDMPFFSRRHAKKRLKLLRNNEKA